jgi:hypothetical protein
LTGKPAQKVTAGALAGAVTTIGIWLIKTFGHVEIPGEIGAAITTVLTFIVSYLVPPSGNDQIVK